MGGVWEEEGSGRSVEGAECERRNVGVWVEGGGEWGECGRRRSVGGGGVWKEEGCGRRRGWEEEGCGRRRGVGGGGVWEEEECGRTRSVGVGGEETPSRITAVPTLLGGSEDGSWQLRVWFCCLCSDHNVGAILSCPESNGLANATAGPGDEQSTAC